MSASSPRPVIDPLLLDSGRQIWPDKVERYRVMAGDDADPMKGRFLLPTYQTLRKRRFRCFIYCHAVAWHSGRYIAVIASLVDKDGNDIGFIPQMALERVKRDLFHHPRVFFGTPKRSLFGFTSSLKSVRKDNLRIDPDWRAMRNMTWSDWKDEDAPRSKASYLGAFIIDAFGGLDGFHPHAIFISTGHLFSYGRK